MHTVKVVPACVLVLAVATALLASGCFSRRYPRLMETHLEVLGLYAGKLDSLAQDERTVPPQDWGEFTYPLARARDFARVAEGHYPDRPSLRAFQRALEAYAALVAEPSILSRADAQASVGEQVARFRAAAEEARAELAQEAG